jgi:cyclic 2,3-diphosphoglycerate synthetase
VIVDGEHYPAVTQEALEEIAAAGHDVLAALLVGGKEKLPSGGLTAFGDVRVIQGEDGTSALDRALLELTPDAVLDLSDEPVLDYRRRFLLASVTLARGVGYEGSDFSFTPPPRPRVATTPTIAVIATGKRAGKTAVAGFVARTLVEGGSSPVIVAMGRGGPPDPEVLRGDQIELTPRDLLEIASQGRHAASDYVEDALLGRVPTVGCRRCGGGLAGAVGISNVPEGVRMANDLGGDVTILEGSGAAIPPVHADSTILVVPATAPVEYVKGYFGPYRLLLSDVVILTMCEEPFGSPSQISALTSEITSAFRNDRGEEAPEEIRLIRTVFRPTPTRSVEGAKVFVATTAPPGAGRSIVNHLEENHGCEVVGISHALSDRERLEKEIKDITSRADTLLCEIKAAGIDVATRRAIDSGLDVVYMDNVPTGIDGTDPRSAATSAFDMARRRFEEVSS